MKLRITILIPVLLIVTTLVTAVSIFQQNMASSSKAIKKEAKEQLVLDITRLQNILYNLLTENKLNEAKVNISVSAMGGTVQSLILTDENYKVLAANRYIWEKQPAANVSNFNPKIAQTVKEKNKPIIFYDDNNQNILTGYYPVILKLESGELTPIKQYGILFSEKSIEDKITYVRSQAINQSLLYASMMLISALIVTILLHFLVSRRINLLRKSAQQLASGDLNVQSNIRGSDELSELGASFDTMINQLKIEAQQRQSAEEELKKLNNSLEERIQERTHLLDEAQRIANIGNWEWNIENNKITWSDEVFRILGYEPQSFNPDYDKFLSLVTDEDREKVEQALTESIDAKQKYSIIHRMKLQNETFKWVREEAIPEIGANGKVIKLTGIIQDIHQRTIERQDKEKLERQLQQAQKMESLGQLTGGIAHDFNNSLASIKGFTELALLIDPEKQSDKIKEYLSYVLDSTNNATKLIAQMLTFSRKEGDTDSYIVIDTNNLIEKLIKMLRPMMPSSINITANTSSNPTKIFGNTVMLNQVLMNLCINAKDSLMNDQGEIEITTNTTTKTNCACSSCHRNFSGDFIEIKIKDNGSGMSEDIITNLFEPFFTTKNVGKGTGMGLAMVHGIIHKHKGHILVESEPGEGSSFTLLLPHSNIEENASPINKLEELNLKDYTNNKRYHILVVDDETSITTFMQELLEQQGYRVTIMNSSQKALELFSSENNDISVVVTDYTMPDLNGAQMSEQILEIAPDTPIVMCTGYSEHVDEEKAKELGIKAFLHKPVEIQKLLQAIKHELN